MDEEPATINFAKMAFASLQGSSTRYHEGAELSLKRRSLLIGSAGAFFSTAVAAAIPSDELNVAVGRDEFTISFAGRIWRLRHGTLGVESRVRYRQKPNGRWPIHEIAVENGAWPGTGQQIDFIFQISRAIGAVWRINFVWATASTSFDVPFLDWLDGRIRASATTQRAFTVRYGTDGAISVPRKSQWTLTPDWQWEFISPSGRMTAPAIVTGEPLSFDNLTVSTLPGNAPEVADYVGTAPARYLSRLRLHFRGNEEIPIVRWTARDKTHSDIALTHPINSPADIYAGIVQERRRAFVRMDGASVLRIGTTSSYARRILLSRTVVAGEVGLAPVQVGVAAVVRKRAQIVSLDPGTVTITGGDENPINFNLSGVPFDLQINASLSSATLPIDGADFAEISFSNSPLQLVIGDETSVRAPDPAFPPRDEATRAVVRFTAETTENLRTVAETVLPLSKAMLRLLRARDLMDLRFRFRHMSLAIQGRSPTLIAHRGAGDGDDPVDRSLLIVEIAGQSKLEEAFHEISKKPPFLPEAYMAAPSRLVFDLNLPSNDRLLPFNAQELTRWAKYSMVVMDRALPADTPIAEQPRETKP
jgi:hypothetical protein